MSNQINVGVVYEVVKKLIGKIEPVGDHSIDEDRKDNLNLQIVLIDYLLMDLQRLNRYGNDHRASVKEIGKISRNYLDGLKELLEESE